MRHRRLPEGSGGDLGDGLRNPRAAHAIDDHVLVEVHLVAVGRMTGVRVERTTWNVIEVRDGKVASGRAYLNEAEGLEAAGLSK
jgi:ketosteroid isomerase-like protein